MPFLRITDGDQSRRLDSRRNSEHLRHGFRFEPSDPAGTEPLRFRREAEMFSGDAKIDQMILDS